MSIEAIVLAGGLGTRLRSVVPDLPKPMAPVHGRPFLAAVLDELDAEGFCTAILAVGYRREAIQEHFGNSYKSLRLQYSVEAKPLGTGGAIRLALTETTAPNVFVLNGDTYLELDYRAMLKAQIEADADLTVAVHAVPDAARYGALDIADGYIQGFFEKGRSGPGSINGGVYLMSRNLLDRYTLPAVFSFETDVLMRHVKDLKPLVFHTAGTFIDIGVPEDYTRAEESLDEACGESGKARAPWVAAPLEGGFRRDKRRRSR